MRAIRLTFAIALLTLLSASPIQAQESATQTVLIGYIAAMTQSRGQSLHDAAQFAVNEANKLDIRIGGKLTRFKLFVADDRNDPKLAVLSARAAVAAGVVGMVGHYSTDASIAAAPVYRDAGIAQVSPATAGREFTKLNFPTIFQLLGNSDVTPTYLVESALNILHAQRLVVVDDNTALGIDLAKKFILNLESKGSRAVVQDRLDSPKTSNFNVAMEKIRNANADVVHFAGIAPQTVAFSVRMQQLKLNSTLLLASGAIHAEFPQNASEYAEGTMLLAPGLPTNRMANFKKLEKAYKENFKAPLIPQSWCAYDAVNLLIDAMKQNDSIDPKRLSPTLRNIRFNGMSGLISFDKEGNLNNPRYTLYRASQGSWQEVRTFP